MATRACLCGVPDCKRHGRRPSRNRADYGAAHQERRRRMLASTPEICARCGKGPILGDPWEAGHVLDLGAGSEVRREHRSCNRRAGAQLAAQRKREAADAKAERRIAETRRLLGRPA